MEKSMCGICGFFGKKKNKREIVEKMKEKLVHRGPDAQGSFVNDSVALGFRRLSIIDLEGGLQPMKSSSQNLTVVFNGEIYNYQELREQMEREKKILFVTRSDTETLVNGLEAYGPAFVEQLRGMFAFAVWNEKKEELMLARDFFGIKPLFYTVVDGNFVFASEIKSILQFPGVPKKLNERALEQYLSFQYSVLEETFFEGIYRLPPGCMLFYRQGKYEICRYFQPKLQPEAGCSLADMEKKLESVLKKSVRRHMVSDVEVGTFLSGGVDSGFIAVSSGAKMAFTVGFLDGNSGYNEENMAREVARYAHLSYHMHTIGKKEFWDVLPKVMYALDEPSGDASAVAMYFLAAKASRYVKVVLSGEGADELFGGYNIYREPLALQKVAWIPEKIRRAVSRQAKKLPDRRGKSFLIRAGQRVEERFIGNAHIFTDEERRELLKNPTDTPSCQEFLRKTYEEAAGLSDPEKMQNIDLKYWLAGDILQKTDRMSMAHSLEVRVPFLDRDVFEAVRTLPPEAKFAHGKTKYLFRKVARKYIPEDTAARKKLGFPVPVRVWLRDDDWYGRVKKMFQSPISRQYFHTEKLTALLEEHHAGKKDNSRKIWTVLAFLFWYQEYFDE